MSSVQTKCMIVHALVDKLEADLGYYLDRLESECDNGWSPETIQMIQMGNDSGNLDRLSLRIAALRNSMIKQREAA